MSEKPEETYRYFKTFDTHSDEDLQGKDERVNITRKTRFLISSSTNIPDDNSANEKIEKHSFEIKFNNMTDNTIAVIDDTLGCRGEPDIMRKGEKPNSFLQEHSKYYALWPWREQRTEVFQLPHAQFADCTRQIWTNPRQFENSSPVLKWSRHSYAEVLKSNRSPKFSPIPQMEVNHLKNVLKKDSMLSNEEVNCLRDDYENPFGVIGKKLAERNISNVSGLQTDFSCNLNEKSRFHDNSFLHCFFKIDIPDYTGLLNYLEDIKGFSTHEKYIWNELSGEIELWQKYSHKTDSLNAIELNDFIKATDRKLCGHSPTLSEIDKINIYQSIMSTNASLNTFNFRYPWNINWYGVSRGATCIKTLEKYICNSYKKDSTRYLNSYNSLREAIPIKHVKVPENSPVFLSNTLKIRSKNCKSKQSVLFLPLDRCFDQDAYSQETNVITSPTYIAIESELSQLWKDKSQKCVDNNSKHVSLFEDQESLNKDVQNVEDFKFREEMQQSLNDSMDVKASSISNSSSILLTEKEFNYTDVTNYQSHDISDVCVQTINDQLSMATNNTVSILKEASDILLDFESSCDFYKSVRNEVHQEIEKIDQRISYFRKS